MNDSNSFYDNRCRSLASQNSIVNIEESLCSFLILLEAEYNP